MHSDDRERPDEGELEVVVVDRRAGEGDEITGLFKPIITVSGQLFDVMTTDDWCGALASKCGRLMARRTCSACRWLADWTR